MSTKPSIRVALPWLHDAIVEARAAGSLPSLPSLAWLVGRSVTTRAPTGDWRRWLLATVEAGAPDLLRRWPAGPSLAAATAKTRSDRSDHGPTQCWAVAQPVHLAAGMDHVRLAPLADAVPTAEEATPLAASLNGHFADDVLEFAEFVDGVWLVRCRAPLDCTTHDPATAVGRNIHDFLPAGADGARVRSLMNEIQMLLHEHPVNQQRAARRALPVNGLWLWGFGASDLADVTPLPAFGRWTLYADDPWLRSFWRAHLSVARNASEAQTASTGDARVASARPTTGNTLVAVTQPSSSDPAAALLEVDSNLLVPLCRDVRSGALRSLELFDGARVHTLDAYSRWRFWRRPAAPEALA